MTFYKKNIKSVRIALGALLMLAVSSNLFGQTLTYRSIGGGSLDTFALLNDTPYTAVTNSPGSILITSMPTDVTGYAGVDLLYLQIPSSGSSDILQSQADAVLQFVIDGGVLVYNSSGGQQIRDPRSGIRPAFVDNFLATALTCGENFIFKKVEGAIPCASDPNGTAPAFDASVFHPGGGNLLVTQGVQDDIVYGQAGNCELTAGGSGWFVGVPSENAIILANPDECVNPNPDCIALPVLDFVVPAYPGTTNDCGVMGMALFCGENTGILQGQLDRTGCLSVSNTNYANLVYDFFEDSAAMALRNAWADNPANVNPNCGVGGGGGGTNPTGIGVIDCAKTQIATAPVAGEPGQKNLMVTINVTTPGCLSPITISGSGMSLANGITEICTTNTGIQTFTIPVDYDGSALGTTNFTVGAGNDCVADLTNTPRGVITSVYTLDCVPAVGPSLSDQ